MTSFDKGPAKAFQPFTPAPPGLNCDSSEEDEEAQVCEGEIDFTDNPTLKDFLNLSSGGSRFIKATSEARRANEHAQNTKIGGMSQKLQPPQSYTPNNFYMQMGKTPT
jgi:hypothetical protein